MFIAAGNHIVTVATTVAMTAKTAAMEVPMNRDECVAIHWFRHGLRIHDNPALLEAISKAKTLYPVFIFDGKVAGTWNRLGDLQCIPDNPYGLRVGCVASD